MSEQSISRGRHYISQSKIYQIMKGNSLLHLPFGKRAVWAYEGKINCLKNKIRKCL